MEQLLNIALVSPFFLTLAIFTVAIDFAPPVKNEIALATEQEHEEMDHARSSSPEMVAILAPGLGSEGTVEWTMLIRMLDMSRDAMLAPTGGVSWKLRRELALEEPP